MVRIDLNLTIKSKWFQMIRDGQKLEEYRPCYNKQVANAYDKAIAATENQENIFAVAILRNGYNKRSRSVAVRLSGIIRRETDCAGHPEWGEPYDKHFVLRIGGILYIGPYEIIKGLVASSTPQTRLYPFPLQPDMFCGIEGEWRGLDFYANIDATDAKPCPFCGNRPILERHPGFGWHIRCPSCGDVFFGAQTGQKALEHWNTRYNVKPKGGEK